MERRALEQRLLILTPTGRDSTLASEALSRAGFVAEAQGDILSACRAIEDGAGALLISEEALTPHALRCLSGALAKQPQWSDLPIVIFASPANTRMAPARLQQMLDILGNVTFIERPAHIATLVTAMRAALRARNRQYAARQLLLEVGRQQEETRQRADFEKQLIGIVSHDLRNPLSAILLSTSALLRSEELGPRPLKSVVRIQSSAERAIRLVKDLLDFTQARLGGGIPVDLRPTDLHGVVRGVLEEVEAAHPGRRVTASFEGGGEGLWDTDRLGQVVLNLVTNAIKYSPEDEGVEVSVAGDADEVVLRVHNGGPAIPRALFPSLFQPMTRATTEVDAATRSVGLGLYIVRNIVDAHGGSVSLTSEDEAGTTFEVRLPRNGSLQPK